MSRFSSWPLLALILFVAINSVAQAQTIPANLPDNLKPPAGESLLARFNAKGVQIYTCQASATDPAKFAWTLKGPEATLFNDQNQPVGKHYAGPTWEANDGSKVVGAVKQQQAAPGGAGVAWLLLGAKENAGTGLFSKVTSIQRLNTSGGLAPASGCDQNHKDAETRVDYTATYYFYALSANIPEGGAPATGFGNTSATENGWGWMILPLGLAGLVAFGSYRLHRRQTSIK